MFRLIIVDDEEFARERLEMTLDWESLGFEIAGSFADGRNALEYLKTNKTDVILADIKMTFVSGLELAKIVHNTYPDTIVILISGYKKFEFAREAIQYNVTDYLLKPITYQELYDVFVKVGTKLKERSISTSFVDDELSLQRQYLLSSFLTGGLNDSEKIKASLNEVQIYINPLTHPAAIINIHINNLTNFLVNIWKLEKDRLYNALNQFMQKETTHAYFLPFQYSFDNIKIIAICKSDDKRFQSYLDEYLVNLSTEALETFKLSLEPSILQISDSLMHLNRFKPSDILATQQSRMLLSYIHAGNIKEAEASVSIILSTFQNNIEMLRMLAIHLISDLIDMIGIKEDIYSDINLDSLKNKNDVDALRAYILHIISYAQDYYSNNKLLSQGNLIERALQYMTEHCSEDITLDDVANYIYLSPAYFSRYFKAQMNEKFIDCLSRIRIEKAQLLLKNNQYKIYEVCELTGYKKIEHFNRLFKLYTGFTPSEYRNNLIRGCADNE